MAWSDEARRAALEARRRKARKTLYEPPKNPDNGLHMSRKEMANHIRDMRGGRHGREFHGYSILQSALQFDNPGRKTPTKIYTNVKGADFFDQGLKGTAWRKKGSRPAPSWSAIKTKFSSRR